MRLGHLHNMEPYVLQSYLSTNTKIFDMANHSHGFLELNYQVSGKSEYNVAGKSFFLADGDLLILNSSLPHRKVCLSDQPGFLQGLTVYFHEETRNKDYTLGSILRGCPALSGYLEDMDEGAVIHNAAPVANILSAMLDEYSGKANLMYLKALLIQLFFLIDKLLSGHRPLSPSEHMHKRYAEILKIHIRHRYRDLSGLEDIESFMGLNSTYLERIFHGATGSSIYQFMIETRLAAAAEVLRNTDIPIGEIDELIGMRSRQTFYLQFKKRYKVSPSQYRKSMREKGAGSETMSPAHSTMRK